MAPTWFAGGILLAALPSALGDGVGMIGYGITMYQPPCAFACRSVVASCPLTCTPHLEENHDSGHSAAPTPPECYANDQSFLRTLALCINNYCHLKGNPHMGTIEEYWSTHVATGSIGTYDYKPALTYQEAVAAARQDEQAGSSNGTVNSGHAGHRRMVLSARHGGHDMDTEPDNTVYNTTLPIIKSGMPLNVTSYIREKDWIKQYNGQVAFETNEAGHVTYTIIITVVALFLPLAFSSLKHIPALSRSKSWAWINSIVVYPPLWGNKHRQPAAKAIGGGFVPTRGQSWYIMVIVLLNILFLIIPYYYVQPQSIFPTLFQMELGTISNRAGVMAMGNVVALTVFAGRNNPLLNLTGINYDTYLLFHRILGYLAIFHTVLHSILYLAYYKVFDDYDAEVVKPYWIWGIVATLAAVLLWPASVLAVRKRFYEVFLSVHHLLVVLFLVGYFYHIIERYGYKWGYQVWVYIAVAIWAAERLFRLVRMVLAGWKTATVSEVPGSGGEYYRVDIDGMYAHGLVYLYFPTLSWRFWENHPFSVASSYSNSSAKAITVDDATQSSSESEKDTGKSTVRSDTEMSSQPGIDTPKKQRVTIVLRKQSGMTARLAAQVAAATSTLRIPVLVEGSYQASHSSQLSQCSTLLCIAGGVGISAVMPLLHEHNCRRRLYWGMRNSSLLDAFREDLDTLSSVHVETSVGQRIDIKAVLAEELTCRTDDRGPLGIVVCGPGHMADIVRQEVARLAKSGSLTRGIVLMDEAFTW